MQKLIKFVKKSAIVANFKKRTVGLLAFYTLKFNFFL